MYYVILYDRDFCVCYSCLAKVGSVMSAAASDSSPQSLGSGSERILTVFDRRSAVSSVDDMDTGYPSRFVTGFVAKCLFETGFVQVALSPGKL